MSRIVFIIICLVFSCKINNPSKTEKIYSIPFENISKKENLSNNLIIIERSANAGLGNYAENMNGLLFDVVSNKTFLFSYDIPYYNEYKKVGIQNWKYEKNNIDLSSFPELKNVISNLINDNYEAINNITKSKNCFVSPLAEITIYKRKNGYFNDPIYFNQYCDMHIPSIR